MKICMPGQYIQEENALKKLRIYIGSQPVLIIMDAFSREHLGTKVLESFQASEAAYAIEVLEGECCKETIHALCNVARRKEATCVVGVGGGKVLDVAKAIGHFGKLQTVMVPTSAATDGPCSRLSVLYEADGRFLEYLQLHKNPDQVIVDTQVIAEAPARLLRAGIGDALSTYFETEAGYRGDVERYGKSEISETARGLSKQCMEIILREGVLALQAVEQKKVTPALNQVIEAIIYLSCLGFENGSLGAAHSVCNGLSTFPKYNTVMHGEKVAFGTIVQLILEKVEWDKVVEIRNFCSTIELPYKMQQLGIEEQDLEELVARIAQEDQPLYRMQEAFWSQTAVKSAIVSTKDL